MGGSDGGHLFKSIIKHLPIEAVENLKKNPLR
jgi:hypothetical protein